MQWGKSNTTNVPITDDSYTRSTLWQDCNRFSHRPQCLHIRKQTHPHHYWPLKGWPEVFPIPNKKAETIVYIFINNYLSVHMCPRYILSNNWTEFKNQLMDNVLHQLGIDYIFFTPFHPQSSGKLEVFHKYLKPSLKKQPGQLGPIHQPGTCQLSCNSTPYHRSNNLLPHLWERPKSSPTPTARTHTMTSQCPGFWITKFGISPPHTFHSQENMGRK